MDAYVARQPIFNRRKKLLGYELLFRDGTANYVPDMDGDVMTSTVLSNTFFAIGMDKLLGGKLSFINFTQNLLLQKLPLLMPKATTVVEILEDVEPVPELIEACRQMSKKGYTIALDDFVYTPELKPLIELAKIIKFDFRLSTMDEIQSYLGQLPKTCKPLLLAEKIETNEEFKTSIDMGFELFQGYFFCKPEIVKGKRIPDTAINLMQIVVEVNKADFKFKNLEKLIAPDVSLSYKLLRYINSAFFSTANRIGSIQQALVLLGQVEIRRFISMITMSNLAKGKPNELIRAACIRGKFCEMLSGMSSGRAAEGELFTLGMFSLIDAIVDQPMVKVMKALPLSDSIKDALVRRKGELIDYLRLVESYEQADWQNMSTAAARLGVDEGNLPGAYLQACEWSNTFSKEPE
jgi:c-di-GMP-related signal transduction protein